MIGAGLRSGAGGRSWSGRCVPLSSRSPCSGAACCSCGWSCTGEFCRTSIVGALTSKDTPASWSATRCASARSRSGPRAGCRRSRCATWCCSMPTDARRSCCRASSRRSPRSRCSPGTCACASSTSTARSSMCGAMSGPHPRRRLCCRRQPAEPDSAALRWLLRQPEVVVRGGSLRWTDEQRTAAPLELADVQLVLRSRLRRHAMRFDATPPADWGERFSVRGRFTQPLLDGARLAALERHALRRPAARRRAPAAAAPDAAVRHQPGRRRAARLGRRARRGGRGRTVDLALRAVTLQSSRDAKPLALEQIEGRLVGAAAGRSRQVEAQRLGFATADGLRWPARDIRLGWRHDAAGQVLGGELERAGTRPRLMARIASALPLAESAARSARPTAPTGLVRDLAVGVRRTGRSAHGVPRQRPGRSPCAGRRHHRATRCRSHAPARGAMPQASRRPSAAAAPSCR